MNITQELSQWLAAEKESIDSKAQEWFDRAVQHDIKEEEALRNIGELITQRRTLEKVIKELNSLEEEAAKQSETDIFAYMPEGEKDGTDYFSWDDEEEDVPLLFDEGGNMI